MESIVHFSLQQRIVYNLIFVLLTVSGLFALSELPTERYTNVNFGEVSISTYYPGASPAEVESLVTQKLEESINTVEKIEWIKATSYPERSNIRLKFIDDTDYVFLYNEVRLKVLNVLNELPDETDPPTIENWTVNNIYPVIIINLSGDHGNRALSLMANDIKTSVEKIPGVKQVKLVGELTREFHIILDPHKLRLMGISFDEVARVLQDVNISIPAGDFSTQSSEYLIKVNEKFHTREQVVKTIIRRDGDGGFIRLEDLISQARLDYREPQVISSVNGKNAISLQVIKTSSGNALGIKNDIIELQEKFQSSFEREKIEVTLSQDSTVKIKDGLSILGMNMLAGIILVSFIIWYFMGIRNAALVTIGIPFSFMITMLLMYLTGNSLNELTLFAFVLVTGIIVDDAIVVNENIYRHIQEGQDLSQAIVSGTSEVALPVISSTLTTIAAFLPMLIMTGATGDFFSQIPIAVTYALLASLAECLLILPIHYLDFGPCATQKLSERLEADNFILFFVRSITRKALEYTLKFRLLSLSVLFLLLLASLGILFVSATGKLPLIKMQFFPSDYKVYYVDIKGPPNTSVNMIDEKAREISKVIMADGPGKVESTAAFAGYYIDGDSLHVHGNNFGLVIVTLPAKDHLTIDNPMKHLNNMRIKLKKTFEHDGYTLNIHPQKEGPRTGKDINIRILGSNFISMSNLASELNYFLHTEPKIAPFLVGLEDDRGQSKRIYRFDVHHERANEYNLHSGQVARLAAGILDGRYIGKYRLNDEEIDLKIFMDPNKIVSPEQALNTPLIENATGPILLGDVSRLRTYKEAGELHRYQGHRAISLKADIKEEAPTSAPVIVNLVTNFYEKISANYPGAMVIFGGEHEATQNSYQSLAYAFVIAIMIMYIILAAQFQSYLQPLIILSAIVFALIGVVFGKLITQSIFTVNSFLAIIGVAGVVVNGSLMLIDFMNKSYRSGLSRRESIDEGIRVRLRPILLTTLTTTLGLLPMAVGIPEYSQVWGSMASTFVTGLATATLLTLFIVPVLWDLVQARQEKINLRKVS